MKTPQVPAPWSPHGATVPTAASATDTDDLDTIAASATAFPNWHVSPTDQPGPVQTSRVNEALSRLRGKRKGRYTLTGTIGRDDNSRMLAMSGFFGDAPIENLLAISLEKDIGEDVSWTVTKKGAAALAKRLLAAAAEAEAGIPVDDERITPEEADAKRAILDTATAEREAIHKEAKAATDAALDTILAKRPPDATALIVAHLLKSDCDSQTDYYAGHTVRTVAIGWRTGARESFQQLRKVALTFGPTGHLDKAECEHRDNYSMGQGNWLGTDRYFGWQVVSVQLGDDGRPGYGVQGIEDGLPDPTTPTATKEAATGDGYEVIESTNKRGAFWLVIPFERVERCEFERLRDSAKAVEGWYSRKWGKTPGGYGFTDREAALEWAGETFGPSTTLELDPNQGANQGASRTSNPRKREADRLEILAEGMQETIDYKRAPLTQNWTERRGRIKDGQRQDADRLELVQHGLCAISWALRANTLPGLLAGLATKSGIDTVLSSYNRTPAQERVRVMLRDLMDEHRRQTVTEADRTAEADRVNALEVERLENSVRRSHMPGFFPTPVILGGMMVEAVEIEPDHHVLEPSAGIGSILDGLPELSESGSITAVEIAPHLCEILKVKGYDPRCADFLNESPDELGTFDRILMNPPFEKGADVKHVVHAWEFLAPGGRIVALVTPKGAGILSDGLPRNCTDLAVQPLPDGSFTGKDAFRQTGVSVVMVTMDKGAE